MMPAVGGFLLFKFFMWVLIANLIVHVLADWAGYSKNSWQVSCWKSVALVSLYHLIVRHYRSVGEALCFLLFIFLMICFLDRFLPDRSESKKDKE